MDRQNLTLLTDLYELTMMQGYFKNKEENNTVIFDAFFRNNPFGGGYSIMCGIEQLVKYIKELHFSKEDISISKSSISAKKTSIICAGSASLTRISSLIFPNSASQARSTRSPKDHLCSPESPW